MHRASGARVEAKQTMARALKVFSNGTAPRYEKDALDTLSKIEGMIQILRGTVRKPTPPIERR